jgi:AcrR family transcriptional regulator
VIITDGFERRSELKKQAIIQAAKELFTERGVTDVGISEIAAKAHVSQVSIYNYFGDKNTLAKEVFTAILDAEIEKFEEILDTDIPFCEKYKILSVKNRRRILEIKSSQFRQYALQDKVLQRLFEEALTIKSIHAYMKFVEAGKKEGANNKDIPDDAIRDFIVQLVSFIQRPDFLQMSEVYIAGFFKLMLYGLFGKERPADS